MRNWCSQTFTALWRKPQKTLNCFLLRWSASTLWLVKLLELHFVWVRGRQHISFVASMFFFFTPSSWNTPKSKEEQLPCSGKRGHHRSMWGLINNNVAVPITAILDVTLRITSPLIGGHAKAESSQFSLRLILQLLGILSQEATVKRQRSHLDGEDTADCNHNSEHWNDAGEDWGLVPLFTQPWNAILRSEHF